MSDFEGDSSSSSDNEYQNISKKPSNYAVSILRHLPQARKIMQGHNYEHQITKCVYDQPLSNIPAFVIPSTINTQNLQLPNNRLVKIQDALFEHQHMKQKIRSMLQKDSKNVTESVGTLWNLYSGLIPSYMRFGAQARKNNFANIIMPINGVHITISNKISDKPVEPVTKSNFISPDSIRFDSHFESGNLLYAYRKQCQQIQTYDLILQNDINTKGHNQWFYFKICNTKKHNRIRINIINFIKNQSMFSYGIKLLTFSQRDYNRHKIGWVRDGEKICYFQNKIKRQCNGNNYFTLSFQYYFREVDTVYFAPSHPYTYTQLTQYFDNLMAQHSLSNFISLKTVTQTAGRNSISVLTVGTGKKQIKDCSIAWILGRQHPGQTTSSFMIQGIINYLVSLYSNPPPDMREILDSIIFKVVPMINVDGVVHGNTRAELTGVDPNRMWKRTMKRLCPSVSIIKKLIGQNKQNVKLVLDLHSHSKKTGCFFYGNSLLHDPKSTKIYPTIVCDGDQRFQLKYCRFRGGYETTARSVLFYDLGIKQVYTVQCSLLGYLKKNRITQYKITDYHEMGKRLVESFIQLERVKVVKAEKQIIEEIGERMIDKQDAQSARSQSSLSDEQYEEIKTKVKNKPKKKKIKKSENEINPPAQTDIQQPLKYFVKKTGKPNCKAELSLNQKKKQFHERELSSNDLRNKYNILNMKNYENRGTKQNSLKKSGISTLKQIGFAPRVMQNKKLTEKDQNQQKKPTVNLSVAKISRDVMNIKDIKDNENKNVDKREVQVQVCINIDERGLEGKRVALKSKTENSLCIIGSSLEDDLLYIGRNEVGVQNYQELIQQAMAAEMNKKSAKIKRIPKILNYLCSNLIGIQQQNSVLPQDRRLAPIAAKKYVNPHKI